MVYFRGIVRLTYHSTHGRPGARESSLMSSVPFVVPAPVTRIIATSLHPR